MTASIKEGAVWLAWPRYLDLSGHGWNRPFQGLRHCYGDSERITDKPEVILKSW